MGLKSSMSFLLALMVSASGCGSILQPHSSPMLSGEEAKAFGGGESEAFREVDGTWQTTRSLKAMAQSAQILEALDRSKSEVAWRLARAYATIASKITRKSLQRKLLRSCVRLSERVSAETPDKPEGYAWLAVCRGVEASLALAPGRETQEKIEDPATVLAERFPTFESGLGHRILGALYAKAPPWPAGVGDLDSALELHEFAFQSYPEYPANAFFLAETCLRAGQRDRAISLYRMVLAAPRQGEWALIGAPYRSDARQALSRLNRESAP